MPRKAPAEMTPDELRIALGLSEDQARLMIGVVNIGVEQCGFNISDMVESLSQSAYAKNEVLFAMHYLMVRLLATQEQIAKKG